MAILSWIIGGGIGIAIGFILGKITFERLLTSKKQAAENFVTKAETEAKKVAQDAERKAQKLVEKTEKELEHRQKKIDQYEERIAQKEEKLDQRMEKLEEKKEEMNKKSLELERIVEDQQSKLANIAQLTPEQAKQQLFEQLEQVHKEEIAKFINKMKLIKEEESKEDAAKIIAKVLPRVVQEGLSEHLTTMVDLPTEDMKGKIIGRE